jgi:hypothetical protein
MRRSVALLGVRVLRNLDYAEGELSAVDYDQLVARIVEPIRMHPSLMEAAQSHADYYALNNGQMPGLHNQTPGAPGYSGATMSERAENFGYDGSINENVGLSGSILSTVDWSIATINHRLTLIDPRYTDIGFGTVNTENGGMETIKLGTDTEPTVGAPAAATSSATSSTASQLASASSPTWALTSEVVANRTVLATLSFSVDVMEQQRSILKKG